MSEPSEKPGSQEPAGGPSPPGPDPVPAENIHHHFLAWAGHVPGELLARAREKVKATYAKLEGRYGTGYARAIVGAGLVGLPVPVPFSTALTAAPVIAAAEIHRAWNLEGGLAGVGSSVQLTLEEIEAHGKHFVQQLLHEFAGEEEKS
jgi:hypothetical protein